MKKKTKQKATCKTVPAEENEKKFLSQTKTQKATCKTVPAEENEKKFLSQTKTWSWTWLHCFEGAVTVRRGSAEQHF